MTIAQTEAIKAWNKSKAMKRVIYGQNTPQEQAGYFLKNGLSNFWKVHFKNILDYCEASRPLHLKGLPYQKGNWWDEICAIIKGYEIA